MKKLIALVLGIALLVCCVAGCGSNNADTNEKDKFVIGICQIVKHEALDAATNGFKAAVIEALGEDNVEFIFQDAANNPDTCVTIMNDFVNKKVDLILANATPALQAAYNATETIPILGTSVTEYGVALKIENFTGTVGGNVSGTSDLAPLTDQAQMVIDLVPTAKTVGMLYCSAEPNSDYQVKEVTKYLEGKGLTVKSFKFSGSEDVAQVTEAAAAACDVIYVPTDNTAASCAETIGGIVTTKKVPVIAGEAGICKGCGIATLSISYEELGRTTGAMAVKVLKGETKIEEMAIEYDTKPVKKYNKTICDLLGITPPEGYEALS